MVVFIILGVLVLALIAWLVYRDRRVDGHAEHDVGEAARRARGDADRFGGGTGGDGMNAG